MYTTVCAGYISTTFVDAVEVSKCYSVNSENYCFYTSGSVLSWNEAKEFCARRNSTLPIITDEDIDNVFQQFIVNDAYSVIQNTSVWIDAHARPVNSNVSWHWTDGRTSGNYVPIMNVSLLQFCWDILYVFFSLMMTWMMMLMIV